MTNNGDSTHSSREVSSSLKTQHVIINGNNNNSETTTTMNYYSSINNKTVVSSPKSRAVSKSIADSRRRHFSAVAVTGGFRLVGHFRAN